MSISREEQETIINFSADDKTAWVYTCDPVYIRKMDKLCERCPESYKLIKQDEYSKTYSMPKKLVSFRTPVAKRELTDEERAVLSERMKNTLSKLKKDDKINSELET